MLYRVTKSRQGKLHDISSRVGNLCRYFTNLVLLNIQYELRMATGPSELTVQLGAAACCKRNESSWGVTPRHGQDFGRRPHNPPPVQVGMKTLEKPATWTRPEGHARGTRTGQVTLAPNPNVSMCIHFFVVLLSVHFSCQGGLR